MTINLDRIVEHDFTDDCAACRAQEIAELAIVPAAAGLEAHHGLPQYSLALFGAAALLGVLLEEGVERGEIEATLGRVLDEIEQHIAEDKLMGGPTQGSA